MTASTADAGIGPSTARPGFGAALARLSTKSQTGSLDRALRVVGPVLMPLGLLVIVLGWYGAANTTRVFLQIPYLISGGLIGLSLVFAGGFVYFSRWMNDLIEDGRRQAADAHEIAERTARSLERIEQLLAAGALAAPAGAPSAPASAKRAPAVAADTPTIRLTRASDSDVLVVTEKGSLVHRETCRLVDGRDVTVIDQIGERERCRICRPPLS